MKINPSQIQAYRNIPDPARISGNQTGMQGQSAGRASGSKASAEIAGSRFLDMLSKAEKQFLADKFDTTATRKSQSDLQIGKDRGRLLDIRV